MNRAEFMRQLESLLQSISQTEREEALQYYNDYFDDAGAVNEQEVIEALGNPARVAENIKRDLTLNVAGTGTAGRQDSDYEHSYRDEDEQGNSVRHPIAKYTNSESTGEGTDERNSTSTADRTAAASNPKKEPMPTWQIVLLVIAGILLAPVAVGLLSGLVSAIFGLLTGWFSLILGFGAAAIALILVLFVLIITGIICLAESPFAGIAIMGGGLICGGLGILFLMITVAMAGIVTPAIFRGLAKLCRWIAAKIRKEAKA